MNAFIVELDNRPGAMARIAQAIADRGIDITGFAGVTAGGSGAILLITNDEPGTRKVLAEQQCTSREIELVTVGLEARPGTLAAVANKLAEAGINIEGATPIGMSGGTVQVAFATDDPAKARSVLGQRVMTPTMG
ncbi:MAG: hypothetical protein A2V85_15535 [Chloroflexi bacterium RBG_16_72_14]|nr:MAG: hypothetical protein A2V85_15535 [Chloroflexi bacterium RBG_16_72_14]